MKPEEVSTAILLGQQLHKTAEKFSERERDLLPDVVGMSPSRRFERLLDIIAHQSAGDPNEIIHEWGTEPRIVRTQQGNAYELKIKSTKTPNDGRRTVSAFWSDEHGNRRAEAVNDWFINNYPDNKPDLDMLADIEWSVDAFVGADRGQKLPGAEVDITVLPGGRMPERKSDGAIGYDVYARAIVSETEQDEFDDRLRKTVFNFKDVPGSAWLQEHIIPDPDNKDKWAYILRPGEHVLIGVGFATALPDEMLYWLTPRSGLSMKRLTLTNAPGTVDPDYRGEAGALLVNQSESDFILQHQSRIAQAVFCPVYLPRMILRQTIDDLGKTNRSGGGFGSTGLLD